MGERGKLTHLEGPHQAMVDLATVAAGAVDDVPVFRNSHGATIEIRSVKLIPKTAITGHAADFMTLSLRNKGLLGVGAVVVATKAYAVPATDDVPAFGTGDIPVSGTAANLLVLDGEVLALDKAEAAAGMALNGALAITYRFK
jgi:hypothetical protein